MSTKEQILISALDLFSRYGFAGASIRKIANEVGIRESGIYNHFKSKDEILGAIFEAYKPESLNTEIMNDELIEKLSDPHQFMHAFSLKLIDQWNLNGERKFFRLLMMEQFREKRNDLFLLSDYLEEVRSVWWMIFDELIKHKFISPADPIVLANMFISPLYIIRMEFLTGSEGENLGLVKKMVKNHVDSFWSSISNN